MLLASAGQAAPYTYDSSATRKISSNNNNNNNNNNSSTSNNTGSNNNNVNAGTSTPSQTIGVSGSLAARPTTASSIASNAATAIMKTLSVRLHRGTEFIKDTVQKALVINGPTPGLAPLMESSLKRKLLGTGGIMGTSGNSNCSSSSASSSNVSSITSRHLVLSQPYVLPTASYLREFAMAPTQLHRSASARKRNPSTDSLLMDLCVFKPIRPMPITPIKINKARGFELKRPKFVPPSANLYSDADDDDDDEEDAQDGGDLVRKQQELTFKPKLSTLTLPQHATASAFVPHEAYCSSSRNKCAQTQSHTKDNSNTHTSGTGSGEVTAKPKATATKRRRRAPLLTLKRRRKGGATAAVDDTVTAATAIATSTAATAASASAPKRKGRAVAKSTSISPIRRSPPMTRQRARLQISSSRN